MFQEEEGFDFRKAATRHPASAELRRFSPDSVVVHRPDVCCRSGISLKNQQNARNLCKPFGQLCVQRHFRTIEKDEIGFSWCTMTNMDAEPHECEEWSGNVKPGSGRKSNYLEKRTSHGRDSVQKTGFVFVHHLEQNVKPKPVTKKVKMFEHRVPRNSFPDDHAAVVGYDGSGPETSISRRLAAMGT